MKKKNIIVSIVMSVICVVYTLLVKYVDVKPIGPNNSEVGFASMNGLFKNLIGHHNWIYVITEIFGVILLLLVVIYGSSICPCIIV